MDPTLLYLTRHYRALLGPYQARQWRTCQIFFLFTDMRALRDASVDGQMVHQTILHKLNISAHTMISIWIYIYIYEMFCIDTHAYPKVCVRILQYCMAMHFSNLHISYWVCHADSGFGLTEDHRHICNVCPNCDDYPMVMTSYLLLRMALSIWHRNNMHGRWSRNAECGKIIVSTSANKM